MKYRTLLLGVVGLALTLTAATAAYADVRVNVDLNPYGWGAPPPVVYEPPRYYYTPPPVVYYGHGHWGDHRAWRGRDHDRGRWEHHGEGHHDDGDRR